MDPILAQIILWPGTFIPSGWALCDGSTMPIQQNTALYSLLGTTYGGNGTSTFALPDLRGRVPVGINKSNTALSQLPQATQFGAENVVISSTQLPAHTHAATATVDISKLNVTVSGTPYNTSNSNTNIPTGTTCLGKGNTSGGDDANIYSTSTGNGNMASPSASIGGSASASVTVQPAGSSTPVAISQPSIVLNYIIATEGIYPTRP